MSDANFSFIWVGFHQEGRPAFEALIAGGWTPSAVITLTPEAMAVRSGAMDYQELCRPLGVPVYAVNHINDKNSLEILRGYRPHVLFVIGWSQLLGAEALATASLGVIGAHASLLPHGRGSAPINWALIKGETQAGNSLIWLENDVDSGAVIDQVPFPITSYDTCASLYEKVARSNREMILRLMPKLAAGQRPGVNQPSNDSAVLPRRRPSDGALNWNQPAGQVYNFIRALTRPYPGAFSWIDGKRWLIWQAALLPEGLTVATPAPGMVVGSVVSPNEAACGILVSCGDGRCVLLLELEDQDGQSLSGACLAEKKWHKMSWSGHA